MSLMLAETKYLFVIVLLTYCRQLKLSHFQNDIRQFRKFIKVEKICHEIRGPRKKVKYYGSLYSANKNQYHLPLTL